MKSQKLKYKLVRDFLEGKSSLLSKTHQNLIRLLELGAGEYFRQSSSLAGRGLQSYDTSNVNPKSDSDSTSGFASGLDSGPDVSDLESKVRLPNFEEIWARYKKEEAEIPAEIVPRFLRARLKVGKDSGFSLSTSARMYSLLGSAALAAAAILIFIGPLETWIKSGQGVSSVSTQAQAGVSGWSGEVYLLNSDGTPRTHLRSISKINPGDRIAVGPQSYVDLSLTAQSSIRIKSDSRVTLEKLRRDQSQDRVRLYLEEGTVLAHVQKMKKDSDFWIRTEWGKVEVRGTRFLTQKDAKGMTIAVSEGKVSWISRPGRDLSAESSGSESSISAQSELSGSGSPQEGQWNPGLEIGEYQQVMMDRSQVSDSKNLKIEKISLRSTRDLAELDFVHLEAPLPEKSKPKTIQTEEDLFRIYSILESVTTEEGKEFRGVIFRMDEEYIYIRTVDGEKKIPQKTILYVEKIR
jgi:hypothetical protein